MTASPAQLQGRETARAAMVAAWTMWRSAYRYAEFDRARFGRLLRACWNDVRRANRPAPTRLEVIERQIALLPYRANYREAESVRVALVAERAALIASR